MKTDSAAPTEARVLEILDEYLDELRAGRAPDRGALLARHPELSESLAASFRALDFVYDAQRTLEASEESSSRDEPASAGRVLGDYRLVRELGRGGMAVVYEAEQISLARHVALKVLPFAAVLDPKQLQRFKNEAQAAAHLHHPHIVPVHAVGCERGVHYYAMQYVEGQSLAVAIHEMREGAPSEGPKTPISSHGSNREPAYIRMAAALGVQAAEALDHAHQCGIVHRDVKPGNLLVDLAGTLWVTDFGLAHSMKDVGLTMTGELLGTIRYMSPEQALAKRVPIDHRTDVYSLGATLYELFTLEPAFPGDDPHLLIQNIASKEPVPPRQINPALPRDVETILLKAMSKDPTGRYATAQDLADDLQRFLDNLPIAATRPGLVRRAAKWSRRHRALVGVAVGVLLLAVAGLATGAALLWREQEQTKAAFVRAEANLSLALEALDEIYLSEAEGHPRIREGLPRDLLERGLGFYERFARDNAHRPDVAYLIGTAQLRASQIFQQLGRKDRAEEARARAVSTYRAVIRQRPEDPHPHRGLGNALAEKGDFQDAIREYYDALRIKPDFVEVHVDLSYALLVTGDPSGAVKTLREAIRLDPGFAGAHSNLGNVLFPSDPDGAIREYREAIRLQPDLAEAHNNLAVALFDKDDLDGAIPEYREAIRLKPDIVEAHHDLGTALARKGEYEEAIREIREAIRLAPDNVKAHSNLGIALFERGDLDGAILEYREAIKLEPGFATAHSNLGNALANKGEYDDAIQACREAIRLDPGYAHAHNNLGTALFGKGKFDDAVLAYREAIRLKPDIIYAHGNLAMALAAKGRLERRAELEGHLDQVLSGAIRPRDAVDRIVFAELLYAKSRHAESSRMYAEAFTEDSALAEDLAAGHRYNAACSAALAAARGEADAADWRRRALEWLRADLAAREKAPSDLGATLDHWKKDPDLASVRDHRDDPPEPEREAWRGLWVAVDEALASARRASR